MSTTTVGFGYETADEDYANSYYANYLTPAIDQEVFTQPASLGFAEVPIAFRAERVPRGRGRDRRGSRSGRQAKPRRHPGAAERSPVAVWSVRAVHARRAGPFGTGDFSFELQDRYRNVISVVAVIAGSNGSQKVTGAASGRTSAPLRNCNDTVALSGNENVVTLGSGCDVVHGGQDGAIYLTGAAGLVIHGTDEMVFAGKDDATINDFSKGPRLDIGPTSGHDVLMGFLSDPAAVIDLAGGGYKDTAAVLSALTDDGHGGTLLPPSGSGLDFVGVAPSQLHTANFHIG